MKKIIVLIDDDELVRMTWKFKATASNVEFEAFETSEEFLQKEAEISRESAIYIDANLKDGERGEELALKVHELGFSEIHLASGSESSDLDYDQNIIKSVRGKEPPF